MLQRLSVLHPEQFPHDRMGLRAILVGPFCRKGLRDLSRPPVQGAEDVTTDFGSTPSGKVRSIIFSTTDGIYREADASRSPANAAAANPSSPTGEKTVDGENFSSVFFAGGFRKSLGIRLRCDVVTTSPLGGLRSVDSMLRHVYQTAISNKEWSATCILGAG
jgi:hypothetical protein